MPKAYITRQEKLNSELSAWIYGQFKTRKIPQRVIAEQMGVTQQAFSYKLKTHSFHYEDLVVIFRLLKPDSKTLMRLMGVDE